MYKCCAHVCVCARGWGLPLGGHVQRMLPSYTGLFFRPGCCACMNVCLLQQQYVRAINYALCLVTNSYSLLRSCTYHRRLSPAPGLHTRAVPALPVHARMWLPASCARCCTSCCLLDALLNVRQDLWRVPVDVHPVSWQKPSLCSVGLIQMPPMHVRVWCLPVVRLACAAWLYSLLVYLRDPDHHRDVMQTAKCCDATHVYVC